MALEGGFSAWIKCKSQALSSCRDPSASSARTPSICPIECPAVHALDLSALRVDGARQDDKSWGLGEGKEGVYKKLGNFGFLRAPIPNLSS